MNNTAISVLLVDDHALILQGLKYIVSDLQEVGNVITASTASEALTYLSNIQIDICILDIELPDLNGFELIREIRNKVPDMKIIINTMHEELWMVNKMISMDVDGVVLKSANTCELVCAIKSVQNGEKYFCSEFSRLRRKVFASPEYLAGNIQLTNREYDVLLAISKGLQTREIAELLHVSVNTVESHRKNLFFKLGVRNSVELVIKAIKNGLITLDSDSMI